MSKKIDRLKAIEDVFKNKGYVIDNEYDYAWITKAGSDKDIEPDDFEKSEPELFKLATEYGNIAEAL